MKNYNLKTYVVLFILLLGFTVGYSQDGGVKATDTTITIPTYLVNKPDKNPWFYLPINYQEAQFRIYPYLYVNQLTEVKEDVTYKSIVLENEYTKIVIMPEFGGRVYQALDKTTGYNFYYYNRVIKPTLIGMTGAWISGGIEWNIPHHHSPGSYMPAEYKIVEHKDGSKSVWVGQYEKRQRMRWVVVLTLHPHTTYLEINPRLFNTDLLEEPSLEWINTSVHSGMDYQCVFPEDANLAVYHTKNKFTDWPISYGFYDGNNFAKGYDVSWWKNTLSPTSFFCYKSDYDFMAGIDNGKKRGTVQVGDHHTVPGKKMWNWGNNDIGRMWDDLLTDEDGPYVELMMGTYSDNQPDYTWNAPGQSRFSTMYFYPMKDMDYIKMASKDFAINMDENNGKVLFQINATSAKNVTVRIDSKDKKIYSEKISISPEKAYRKEIDMPKGLTKYDLKMSIVSDDNKELISYSPEVIEPAVHPKPYHDRQNPEDMKSIEDIIFTGIRLVQFSNPFYRPEAYFEEAIKRDANNALANTQMGILALKKYDYVTAEKYLRVAYDRAQYNFTRAKYGEPGYYLGLALMKQGKTKEAYDILAKTAWKNGWVAPSYYLIARMDCNNGDYEKALGHINAAVEANVTHIDAENLKTMILRKLGRYDEAWANTKIVEQINQLSFNNMFEQYLLADKVKAEKTKDEYKTEFITRMRYDFDNYLEVSSRYGETGFYDNAIEILQIAEKSGKNSFKIASTPYEAVLSEYSLIYYYIGYYSNLSGDNKKANSYYKKGASKSIEYCFPYGGSTLAVLQDAVKTQPEAANTHYLLGELLCDNQPEVAEKEWKETVKLNPKLAIAYRNLAWVQGHILEKTDEAIANIKTAIKLDPEDAEYYADADEYLKEKSASVKEREAIYEGHVDVLRKSDKAFTTYLQMSNMDEKYQLVIDEMSNHRFRVLENVKRIHHQHWAVAHLMLGRQALAEGKYDEAIKHFEAAKSFPKNLELIRDGKEKEALYYLAQAYKAKGDKLQYESYLKELLEIAPVDAANSWGAQDWIEITYYKVLAARELGMNTLADDIHVSLWDKSKAYLNKSYHSAWDWRSVRQRFTKMEDKAYGYFSLGLFYYASNEYTRAKENFEKTLEILPAFFSAKDFLDMTNEKINANK
jgi:tetratricopeptide (TPR) repeat protein